MSREKLISCNMAHRASFLCDNMLQVFESDLNTCNLVAQIHNVALKIVFCKQQTAKKNLLPSVFSCLLP